MMPFSMARIRREGTKTRHPTGRLRAFVTSWLFPSSQT
jgi:hypothetical protein